MLRFPPSGRGSDLRGSAARGVTKRRAVVSTEARSRHTRHRLGSAQSAGICNLGRPRRHFLAVFFFVLLLKLLQRLRRGVFNNARDREPTAHPVGDRLQALKDLGRQTDAQGLSVSWVIGHVFSPFFTKLGWKTRHGRL